MSSESYIERRVCELTRKLGVISLKLNVQGQTGWPDRLFLIPGGYPLFIEFKRPGGRVGPKQRYMHQLLRNVGYNVQVHDNIEDAMQSIKGLL